jgi:hypothetical protein
MAGIGNEGQQARAKVNAASFRKNRRILLQFLVICLPLYLSLKMYAGPYHEQVGIYLSGILLIIIWALLIQLIVPTLPDAALMIALFVLLCAVELACQQYPSMFEPVSFAFKGKQIIGGVCTTNKIPYFGVGAFIGYFILKACRLKS